MATSVLLSRIDIPDSHTLPVYEENGGYEALKKVLGTVKPEDLIEEVKGSGLRGRGGAGFPAGTKWGFVPKESPNPKYLACNADEGEPGTFKDRLLILEDPHQLIEGIIISSYAIGVETAFIYIRGEYHQEANILDEAIAEAYDKGYLGKNILGSGYNLELILHRGAGSYVCGDETALMESLEGHRGNPRLKPPFPASVGLYGGPTVINNVETLSAVPFIAKNGADAYKAIGTKESAGTKLFCVSGNVKQPGVYELPLGFPMKELIYGKCGGIADGRKLKGVIPGGSSTPILLPDEIEDLKLAYEHAKPGGFMLGSGAVIVIDERWCMVKIAQRLAKFYAHESCGQCTPCREGTTWTYKILKRIEAGGGKPGDPDLLLDIQDNIFGKTLCPLGDAAAMPIIAIVKKFRGEFERHIEEGRCPFTK
jgi:NADH-quinone oxidoreductase subunit F